MDSPDAALLRLLTWLSPAFPVGAFAYSHGLEQAIHEGSVRDRASLVAWIDDLLAHGSGWNDAVLLAEAWRAGEGGATAVIELAAALAGSRERHLETTQQGAAFREAAAAWGGETPPAEPDAEPVAYPVAVGLAARRHGIALRPALTAYVHAFATNLIQVSLRLVPLGQRDGLAAQVALEPLLLATASRAAASSLDDLGSAAFLSEVAAMRHETLYSRVFRT